ncbi:MAG: alkaline phosphatase [Thermoleophilaceae bacterium]|jgi:alkaline phosphatase D|nr:alkaline phosphatase [Thermoleophilaceae bacterium]
MAGAGGLAAAAVLTGPDAFAQRRPRGPSLRGGRFAEGVLSGDPTPDGITLWTRLSDAEGSGTVEVEVARDRGFRRIAARGLVRTSGGSAHSVKTRVVNLRPYEDYWYRFSTRGAESQVGRFRTALPPDSRQPVRFAFFSCQDYTAGYFTPHTLLAAEDIDFVVNLGDYIYAEAYYSPGDVRGGVRLDPIGFSETLEQYRAKYALYRTDARLRHMHSRFPMVSIWDDHEVQDNYAGSNAEPDGGLAPELRYTRARRDAAYRAYFESMPTYGAKGPSSNRIYRGMRFGRTLDLVMLDQRQYRADQPCGDPQVGPACDDVNAPRNFLGRRQMSFVKKRLASSPAAWKVLANQVMVMPTIYPGGDYIGFDSWQGYPRERQDLLEHIRRKRIEDVVFVTGDIHTFIAGDVRVNPSDRRAVATEFVGGSISSPGLGEGGGGILPTADPFNPNTPQAIIDLLRSSNPWARDADFDHHGYGLVTATQEGLSCTLRRVDTVKRPSRKALPDKRFSYRIGRGEPSLLD